MPTYLILRKTGPAELDLKPTAVIHGKSTEEVDEAIAEGAMEGPGDYVALSVSSMVERTLRMRAEVVPTEASEPVA